MTLSAIVGVVPVAAAGLDIDTDGVFDERRILVAWLFGAIIVLLAISSALVVRRRTETRWVRWLAVQGVLGLMVAVVIGAAPRDMEGVLTDGERRDVLCGPVLNLIRTDPAECGDRLDTFRVLAQLIALASVGLLTVARVVAAVEHRRSKREKKRANRAEGPAVGHPRHP